MDSLASIIAPFTWLVSTVMVGFHDGLGALGMPAASGWTWTLSIIGLVLVIRAALIPVYVQQLRAQQRMGLLQPDLKKLEEKYRGQTDPLSRQAMAQEQMALYKKHGTNPFSKCLPLLIQTPFFLALFHMLSGISAAAGQHQGVGAMSAEEVGLFDQSTVLGAPLTASLLHGGGDQRAVWTLSIAMILAMTAAQLLTQRLIMARIAARSAATGMSDGTMSDGPLSKEVPANPFVRQHKVLLYGLPVVFGVGGIVFPIGVLIYWTTTNLWTLGQQFFIRWDRMGP